MVENDVVKLWAEGIGQCHDDTVGRAHRSVSAGRRTAFSASSSREKGTEWARVVWAMAGHSSSRWVAGQDVRSHVARGGHAVAMDGNCRPRLCSECLNPA
jgi:hypothetical protein